MKRNTILRVAAALCSALLLLLLGFGFQELIIQANAAEYTGGTFLTPQETLEAFGSTIDITYYNGSEYVDTTAVYVNNKTPTWKNSLAVLDYPELMQGTLLHYSANLTGINTNNSYITLRMYPQYSIFDTDKIYTYIAVSSYGVSPAAYQSPSWRWNWDGTEVNIEPFAGYSGAYYPRFEEFNNSPFVFIPVRLDAQHLTSGYSLSCQFNGGVIQNCDIYIQTPYVSVGSYGSNGTIGTTTTQEQGGIDGSGIVSGINETNDILEEHSGLLGDIIDFLHYIFDTLEGDESEVSEVEPVETAENPPDWDDAMSQVESALDDIPDITASGGFIWSLYNLIMTTSPVIKFLVPFGLIITLLSYIWWKK